MDETPEAPDTAEENPIDQKEFDVICARIGRNVRALVLQCLKKAENTGKMRYRETDEAFKELWDQGSEFLPQNTKSKIRKALRTYLQRKKLIPSELAKKKSKEKEEMKK